VREGMGRERQQLVGTIAADGVFLTGYTGWYPTSPGALNRMRLTVTLPPGWLAVSQGAGPELVDGDATRIRWTEEQPQDELYLSAARFKLYRQQTPHGEAQAYLRLPDEDLAARYLDATAAYLARYSALIGAYPYAKFALVENFWETGYGMPSFTLLGSRVMRLPFILHSSYPHEILHNWWGNGVYVDYAGGNWSEGLTAYLSDHLNKALAGAGADYRRDQLKAYADYVQSDEDFPLTAFRGRHGSASQAIGYGKTLMTMHMLRVMLGEDTFKSGLKAFYRQNRFRTIGRHAAKAFAQQGAAREMSSWLVQQLEDVADSSAVFVDGEIGAERDERRALENAEALVAFSRLRESPVQVGSRPIYSHGNTRSKPAPKRFDCFKVVYGPQLLMGAKSRSENRKPKVG